MGISVILDFDLILINDFSFNEWLGERVIGGLPEYRGQTKYFWAGLIAMDIGRMNDLESLNLAWGIPPNLDWGDTGSHLHIWLSKNWSVDKIALMDFSLKINSYNKNMYLIPDDLKMLYKDGFDFWIQEKAFLHFTRGTKWNGDSEETWKEKFNCFEKWLNGRILNDIPNPIYNSQQIYNEAPETPWLWKEFPLVPKKAIVLVMNCKKNIVKKKRIYQTWKPLFEKNGIRVFFVEGNNNGDDRIENDTILLNTSDGYENIIIKLQKAFQILLKDKEWDYIIKTDDDIVLSLKYVLNKLNSLQYETPDVIGSIWDGYHMTGRGYFINRRAVEFITKLQIPKKWNNDALWSGLYEHLKNQEIRKQTIPDDYYYSEQIRKSKLFKINNICKTVFFHQEYIKEKPENPFVVHNLKTLQEFIILNK